MAKKADKKKTADKQDANVSKDEQVGYHKGSLMTLSKERAELVRILGIVEQLMQMHAVALKELGVEIDAQVQAETAAQAAPKKKPPIEDLL